ncbi:oligopeptide/dipeptide ABC transporter ATP-binding protein [Fenollaria massiliensis]|uniref:oligopeptide/dipeptide ABC transporter ATP-binding protein n=1 Tax=Fenollaria massiliensis TaxID=938288 RepID=UPI0003751ADD
MENRELLFRIQNLKQYFPVQKVGKEVKYVKANDDISLDIYKGETIGLVGESGCGKSTFGRTLLQLYKQTDGRTIYYGRTRWEVNPKYVYKLINGFASHKNKLKELKAEIEKDTSAYEALAEGKEKGEALNKLREAEKQYKLLYKDLAQIAGALIYHDNESEVKSLLSKEQELNNKIFLAKKDGKEDSASESELKNVEAKLDSLREEVKGHAEYEKAEGYRDAGVNLAELEYEEMRHLRKDMQLIFQDPYSSLNPRMTVGQIISEGLVAHDIYKQKDKALQDYVVKVMQDCGLAHYFIHRYPHQFSGGQRQRIGIARSVALKPDFIVCDEAVSALDVSIQSQIINLLIDLKEKENLTYLFISHDLSVIKYISDKVGVMYLGNIVEFADSKELYARPVHPYTEALLGAIPTTDSKKEIQILEGDIPSPINPPKGCKFHTRCKYATEECKTVVPVFEEVRPGHFVACHHKLNLDK